MSNRRDTIIVALLAAAASLLAFLYYYRHDSILLYGDAVAHINIARRVFDSQQPSLLHFGTVWLPLPHLLILPFIVPLGWWQSGVGGSIYSMVAYVFATAGIFRLALRLAESRAAAWLAVAIFAANPNLLYLQATAMNESLYLALFIWATVFLADYVEDSRPGGEEAHRRAARALTRSGVCVAAMALTRYDGWFAGPFFVAAAIVVLFSRSAWTLPTDPTLRRGVRNFMLIAAAAPVFWLAYNWVLSGHPLEFALGPYSARAIEERVSAGAPPHPGSHDLVMAATFFRKAAELNLSAGSWQHVLFFGALVGTLLALFVLRRAWPALLLWLPWKFYAFSIAYGSVPIYLPVWWPYSYYNVRYGLQLLPAVALGCALLVAALRRTGRRGLVEAGAAVALVVVGAVYFTAWRATPICLREAEVNARTRVALEAQLAEQLRQLPPGAIILMYAGDHVGALQRAGIPLRRTINESTHLKAERPHGLWERALDDPARYADYLVAIAGDPVAESAERHAADLRALAVIRVDGQPAATVYQVRRASP